LDLLVLTVFLVVYAGMILGEIPGLALDRSGIALLGAIAIVASGRLTLLLSRRMASREMTRTSRRSCCSFRPPAGRTQARCSR
jgi:heme O synthase-like polyprenyltransferase